MRALTPGRLLAACLLAAGPAYAAAEAPLRAGVVPDTPPFVEAGADGELGGFSVALFRAIAGEMHREVVFTPAPLPRLLDELNAGRLDVLAGPIPATPERAGEMLFIEGYAWTEYQFGARPGAGITDTGDLRGKRLAVQDGSDYAGWAERNARKLGFSIVRLPSLAAVFAAVRQGSADVSLTGSPSLRTSAGPGKGLEAAFSLPETRTHDAPAVAETNVELRDDIEDALRCLKQSGAVARLAEQWLHATPGPEDLENMIVPGYGVPDLAGFDAKPRKAHCRP